MMHLIIPVALPSSVDPILKLILFLECIPPSANLVLVVCQQAGNVEAAETLSLGYIMMYVRIPGFGHEHYPSSTLDTKKVLVQSTFYVTNRLLTNISPYVYGSCLFLRRCVIILT